MYTSPQKSFHPTIARAFETRNNLRYSATKLFSLAAWCWQKDQSTKLYPQQEA